MAPTLMLSLVAFPIVLLAAVDRMPMQVHGSPGEAIAASQLEPPKHTADSRAHACKQTASSGPHKSESDES